MNNKSKKWSLLTNGYHKLNLTQKHPHNFSSPFVQSTLTPAHLHTIPSWSINFKTKTSSSNYKNKNSSRTKFSTLLYHNLDLLLKTFSLPIKSYTLTFKTKKKKQNKPKLTSSAVSTTVFSSLKFNAFKVRKMTSCKPLMISISVSNHIFHYKKLKNPKQKFYHQFKDKLKNRLGNHK